MMAASFGAVVGCDGDKAKDDSASAAKTAAAPAKAVPNTPQVDPHATPEAMKSQTPVRRSQTGSFDLKIGDKVQHLAHLPIGENTAEHFEGKKGRIVVTGASSAGYPSFRVQMVGWRLDQLEFPVTLTGNDKQLVSFRYRLSDKAELRTDSEATKRGENKVVLESYDGNVVSGRFEGMVQPKDKGKGEPVAVSGTFKTSLRLRGVARSGGTVTKTPNGALKVEPEPEEPSPLKIDPPDCCSQPGHEEPALLKKMAEPESQSPKH